MHLAVPGGRPDTEPGVRRTTKRGRATEQTSEGQGVCGPVLEPRRVWEGSARTGQGQNRNREIPPSGIVGARKNVDRMGAKMRSAGEPTASSPSTMLLRALHFYPDQHKAAP